jgi:hypothetical protein
MDEKIARLRAPAIGPQQFNPEILSFRPKGGTCCLPVQAEKQVPRLRFAKTRNDKKLRRA